MRNARTQHLSVSYYTRAQQMEGSETKARIERVL
jgi:hypothetical protein